MRACVGVLDRCGGAHVLRAVKAGKVKGAKVVTYLEWACGAGLDAGVIRGLAGRWRDWRDWRDWYIDQAVVFAALRSHDDVIDLLVREYGAGVDVECLIGAAGRGHVATIDRLVEKHGLDVSTTNGGRGETCTCVPSVTVCWIVGLL